MSGKLIGLIIIGAALIAGVAVYYLQVYAFYDELPSDGVEIRLTASSSGFEEPVLAEDIRAIDADSSPLRFRACFRLPVGPDTLAQTFERYERPVPLTAPDWFECFDAAEIGAALEAGDAVAFLGESEIHGGVDRVVAVYADGRAYAWHQLNGSLEN